MPNPFYRWRNGGKRGKRLPRSLHETGVQRLRPSAARLEALILTPSSPPPSLVLLPLGLTAPWILRQARTVCSTASQAARLLFSAHVAPPLWASSQERAWVLPRLPWGAEALMGPWGGGGGGGGSLC